jgi:DNA processing protein
MNELFIDLYDIPRMSEARLKNLLTAFGTPEKIFQASRAELLSVRGIDEELASRIKSYERSNETDDKIKRLKCLNGKIISYLDPDYPKALKHIAHSPPVLFVLGEILPQDTKALAIVGTRTPSHYGQMVAEKFAYELAKLGITIVSGLARGIDTCAHIGALKAQGRTIAVLGCGVDIYYPVENKKYYEMIRKNGAVISEFNLGTGPLAMNFPRRNRIISGLSLGVLVVEAPTDSGVLHTVNWALDQGKEVFAIPGAIDKKTSSGTNQLIKDGAKPVTSVEDICAELQIAFTKEVKKEIPVNEQEKKILDALSNEPLYADELVAILNEPISVILTQLLSLEIKGLVKQLPGSKYIKTF